MTKSIDFGHLRAHVAFPAHFAGRFAPSGRPPPALNTATPITHTDNLRAVVADQIRVYDKESAQHTYTPAALSVSVLSTSPHRGLCHNDVFTKARYLRKAAGAKINAAGACILYS